MCACVYLQDSLSKIHECLHLNFRENVTKSRAFEDRENLKNYLFSLMSSKRFLFNFNRFNLLIFIKFS